MPGNISKLVQSLGHWHAFACVNAPYGCKEVCNSVHMCLCVCNMLQGCAATAVKFDKASLRSPAHVAKPCGRESSIHIFISDISYLYIWKFMDFIWNRVLLPMQGFFLCLLEPINHQPRFTLNERFYAHAPTGSKHLTQNECPFLFWHYTCMCM